MVYEKKLDGKQQQAEIWAVARPRHYPPTVVEVIVERNIARNLRVLHSNRMLPFHLISNASNTFYRPRAPLPLSIFYLTETPKSTLLLRKKNSLSISIFTMPTLPYHIPDPSYPMPLESSADIDKLNKDVRCYSISQDFFHTYPRRQPAARDGSFLRRAREVRDATDLHRPKQIRRWTPGDRSAVLWPVFIRRFDEHMQEFACHDAELNVDWIEWYLGWHPISLRPKVYFVAFSCSTSRRNSVTHCPPATVPKQTNTVRIPAPLSIMPAPVQLSPMFVPSKMVYFSPMRPMSSIPSQTLLAQFEICLVEEATIRGTVPVSDISNVKILPSKTSSAVRSIPTCSLGVEDALGEREPTWLVIRRIVKVLFSRRHCRSTAKILVVVSFSLGLVGRHVIVVWTNLEKQAIFYDFVVRRIRYRWYNPHSHQSANQELRVWDDVTVRITELSRYHASFYARRRLTYEAHYSFPTPKKASSNGLRELRKRASPPTSQGETTSAEVGSQPVVDVPFRFASVDPFVINNVSGVFTLLAAGTCRPQALGGPFLRISFPGLVHGNVSYRRFTEVKATSCQACVWVMNTPDRVPASTTTLIISFRPSEIIRIGSTGSVRTGGVRGLPPRPMRLY
ncbi:uncharacterized protein MYCFIDRAFT_179584 [Pseudocercospora fijiensis CIRAD86]|uniref:Uncharacterized protein n=1 Tax=Pseudocercospora fijiensis (strain CIRAD86) TaxID=383855 RepID=M3ALW3_PSEFD|nr:uncharacterized protein MYCFIDRAFT_179584 [Pseudocercospora fijiensis CIRAD86]EME78138.1 hypothetical protein MYCFIDRAFT_179584 [Pseudocercospora fijiensis CIRAD86]